LILGISPTRFPERPPMRRTLYMLLGLQPLPSLLAKGFVALALCSIAPVGSGADDARGISRLRPTVVPTRAAVTCDMDRYAINTASVPDGTGGTIFVWAGPTGVRAQRLDPSGDQLWDSSARGTMYSRS